MGYAIDDSVGKRRKSRSKKKRNETDRIPSAAYNWNKNAKKSKKKTEEAYSRKVRERAKLVSEKERCENSIWDKVNAFKEEDNLKLGIGEELRHTDKTIPRSANGKSTTSGIPPLCDCVKRLKEKVRIICVENRLYYFNGACYKALDKTKLVQLYRDNVDRNLHGAKNVKGFYELYSYLLTDSEIQVKLNPGKLSNLAILKNGIYNVKKARLEPFDSAVIAFSYVDAEYTEDTECPRFEKLLRDVTGDDSILIERLWRFLGYIFTQSMDAKAFFVMGCAPNSGKSLLGKFIMKLYEPQYVSSVALSDFNGDFSLGTLVGAAVNVSLDLPSSRLGTAAVSKLKMLTGGDLITINEKYVPQFKYQNQAKFIFASNHPIRLVEDDEAFWERLVYLPFNYSVDKSEQDTDLLKKLLKEKDAVVSKALEYAQKLLKENYIFPTTEEIERQVRKWRGIEIDTVCGFLEERCLIGEQYEGETVADLYEAYVGYCKEEGETAKNKLTLKDYLQNQVGLRHVKSRLGKGGNPKSAFCGIALQKNV